MAQATLYPPSGTQRGNFYVGVSFVDVVSGFTNADVTLTAVSGNGVTNVSQTVTGQGHAYNISVTLPDGQSGSLRVALSGSVNVGSNSESISATSVVIAYNTTALEKPYDQFIQETRSFSPRPIVKIGGVDVTDRLVDENSVVTDGLLDVPTLNVFTTARATFALNNSDNHFNTKNSSNFFTSLSPARDADGWQTPVEISVIFESDSGAPTTAKVIFAGYVEQITEMPGPRWVLVLVLDPSGLLQHSVVENFGSDVTATVGGEDDAVDYTEVNPVFNLPQNTTPISRESFSAELSGGNLTVLPVLPLSGRTLTYEFVAVDENRGVLHFGGAPPDGSETKLDVSYKSAYRYRTPEFLVWELLNASGVYSELTANEKLFAKTLIKSPSLVSSISEFSSHGRPSVDSETPVIRWIVRDLSGTYMAGSGSLFRYRRRDDGSGVLDEWDELSKCSDSDAAILQFVKVGNDFYVLTVSDWAGRAAKLWKVTGGTTWAEISSANATATHFYDYNNQTDAVADNRKNFVAYRGYLYYIFNSGSNYGIRRIQLSNNSVSTVISQGVTTGYTWDFTISGTTLYAFACQRPQNASARLRVYSMNLDGTGQTSLLNEEFGSSLDHEPGMVSDAVVRGTNLYFVVAYSKNLLGVGFSELCQLSTSGGTRYVLKKYDNALYAARSLVVHREGTQENIYFLEGTSIASILKEYPTHLESGHLGRIDPHGMVVDFGPVWNSFRDPLGSGVGLHTAFVSNLWSDSIDGVLHFISGYGRYAIPSDDTHQSQDDSVTQSLDNWVWLQYGKNLATKVPVFPTNDRTAWSLLEELARITDFEVGFTHAQDEISDFVATYPHLSVEPKGYLFFRPRQVSTSTFWVDEGDIFEVSSRLDTTLIFNHVSVQYGDGVYIAKAESDRSRSLSLPTVMLTDNDYGWAEYLGDAYLNRQKHARLKTQLRMKFAPQLALGQRIRVTSDYNSLTLTPYRVVEISHDLNTYQTLVELREDLTYTAFSLPQPEDLRYSVGDSVSVTLPAAVGGSGTLTYSVDGAPSWLSFNATTRVLSGTGALDRSELTYKVTDSSSPAETRERKIRLSVVSSVVVTTTTSTGIVGDWSGFGLTSSGTTSQIVVVNNTDNTGSVWTYPSTRQSTLDLALGSGDWVDAGGSGSNYYFLNNTGNSAVCYQKSGSSIVRASTMDIALGTGNWVGIAVNGNDVWVLEKTLDSANVVTGWTVKKWASRVRSSSADITLDVLADYSSIATDGTTMYVLIENAGYVTAWAVSDGARQATSDVRLIDGVKDWVGIERSSVTGRTGIYALRQVGSRVLGYTTARDEENDFLLG